MRYPWAVVLAALVGSSAIEPVSAKGKTVSIEIRGGSLAAPLEIVRSDVIRKFSIWNGPGVADNNQPVAPHPDKETGRFIDWSKGVAPERSVALERYEVTFHLEAAQDSTDTCSRYVVLYEFEASSPGGYIYLPGEGDEHASTNLTCIHHGVEGNWFYSSSDWESLVRPLLQNGTAVAAASRQTSPTISRPLSRASYVPFGSLLNERLALGSSGFKILRHASPALLSKSSC